MIVLVGVQKARSANSNIVVMLPVPAKREHNICCK